ncbi:hypothetical protein [Xanthomonas phage RTH11]|nr:hypothetical protein [Xanthomonas phage RTH11]
MSEFTQANTLGELQKLMRVGDADREFLIAQLNLLAQLLYYEGEKEDGLVRAAIGGMHFCLNRLREIYREEGKSPKSLEALEEIYAGVELGRFSPSREAVREKAQEMLTDFIRCNAHRFEVNGQEFFVLSSATNQTTREGKRLFAGEIIETGDPGVPNFQKIVEHLQKNSRK